MLSAGLPHPTAAVTGFTLGSVTDFARRSGRVLAINAQDRLLLVRSARVPGRPEHGHAWFTPGGGVQPGEKPAEAAARELGEETGIQVTPGDLTWVAYTTGHANLGWANGLFRDDFFLHRLVAEQVDIAGLTDFERTHYAGHHWWAQAELAASDETIYPLGLATLMADLLVGRIPVVPICLPWHH
jgi:8-oxo-dGTP pyrophosphatase MutT (NUDIX family)